MTGGRRNLKGRGTLRGLEVPAIALDVQNEPAERRFKLTRVGVTGVKKPVQVRRPQRTVTLVVDFNVYVDLPATMKGSHLSRNLEVISEIVDYSVQEPSGSLEELCQRIAEALLQRHDYASRADVEAGADYFLERTTPLGKATLERYRLMARAQAVRDSGLEGHKAIGVEVIGMTACPCAMETVRFDLENTVPRLRDLDVPTITHNQRNLATLVLEVPNGHEVEADDLIAIVEGSVSSPTYEILKRGDEGKVVEQAHAKPRFVEDVVREILARILERYTKLPDSASVWVRSVAEESIHKHNAMAERITTLGELRR